LLPEVWKLEKMMATECPKLKRLSIDSHGEDSSIVTNFLTNQPLLEHLYVKLREYFPIKVIGVIQRKSSKLRSITLSIKKFVDPDAGDVDVFPPIDWTFLSTLKDLKSFTLIRPHFESEDVTVFKRSRILREGTGASILSDLPSSLSKLHLKGFKRFWFDSNNIPMESEGRISLMTKFKNLTSLHLIQCGKHFLDDALVQGIIGSCPKLQDLELTHCADLTDFALTGRKEEQTGVSIQSLKGNITHKVPPS